MPIVPNFTKLSVVLKAAGLDALVVGASSKERLRSACDLVLDLDSAPAGIDEALFLETKQVAEQYRRGASG